MIWNEPPLVIPTNGQVVWIRLQYFFGTPFLASYNAAKNEFTSVTNSITYPIWRVARWRPQ